MKEQLKATQSKIKVNNSAGKEIGTQINGLEKKEEINIQLEQNEEKEFKKNEERLRNLQETLMFQHPNHLGSRRRRGRARNGKFI